MYKNLKSLQDAPMRPEGRLLPVVRCGLLLLYLCLLGPAGAQQFAEVSTAAGIASPEGGISMAWGDYDNDGDLDLYLTTRGQNRLYRNNGNGRFTETAASAGVDYSGGSQALWGDYDGDGDLDLLVLDEGLNLLYRNQGDGTFVDVADSAHIQFSPDRTLSGAWADYDNDGDLDFNTTSPLRLYRNNGQGAFAEVGQSAGLDRTGGTGTAWADYDNDGDLDLYVADYTSANGLYRNSGDGTFAKAGLNPGESAIAAAWGDYDNDGDLDLYLVNHLGVSPNRLYRNEGSSFTEVGAAAGVADVGIGASAAWGDADNDGDLDLYLVRENSPNLFYQNNGSGTFTETGVAQGVNDSGPGEGAAWGDYDHDGDLDLYLVNRRGTNRLYRNNGNTNHWLSLQLSGTASNHSAIGAQVLAVTGALRQRRQVEGTGLRAQNSLPVELGFGGAALIDTLAIRWPSGALQVLTSVLVDQFLALAEPVPMAVAPHSLSLGTADLGQTARATLRVTNLGRQPLLIRDLHSSDTQFSASPARFSLAPGDSQLVTLSLTPTRVGALRGVLTLAQETPGGEVAVNISGIGRKSAAVGDPARTRIAFRSSRDGNPAIYLMNALGSGQTRLVNTTAGEQDPAWAPDGTRLVFSSERSGQGDLYTIGIDGSNLAALIQHAAPDLDPTWAPNGSRLAFVSTRKGNAEIYSCAPDGSDLLQLTNDPADDTQPTWAPDGSRLAFVSTRKGNAEIYTCAPDGTDLLQLTTDPSDDTDPAWAPDGTRLAFASRRNTNADIYTLAADGTSLTQLTNNPGDDTQPTWAPDGSRLAFVSTRKGNAEIYSCAPDGSDLLQLTDNPADDLQPAWAPFLTVPLLSLSTSTLAFGEVDRGKAATALLTVTNSGGGILAVEDIAPAGPHFNAVPSRFSLEPGASQTISVRFAPASGGPKADTLRISSNTSGGPAHLTLSGTGLDSPPAPLTSLSALVGRGRVVLTWPANAEADLAYYALYRSQVSTFDPDPNASIAQVRPPALSFADSGLGAGTYYYLAVAVDSAGNRSRLSTPASATLVPLLRSGDPAPSSLVFRGAGTQTLSLADSGSAALNLTPALTGPDAALFTLSPPAGLSVAPGAIQTIALSFAPGATTGAHRSATLYLTHDAANRPNPLTVTLVGDLPPHAPADLQALTGPNQIALSWTANPEADLSHYVVYHSTTPAALGDSVGQVEAPGISFVHAGLTSGRHYYRLRAVDTGGSSSANSDQAQGLIAPALVLSLATTPPALPFGSVRTDTSRTLSFSIANEGSASLAISAITLSGPQAGMFSAIPSSLTIQPGEAPKTLSVTFAPTTTGEQRAFLTLLHNAAPSAMATTITLSGSGTLSAPLVATPDPLDFGRVKVGQRRALTLTLHNPSAAPLSVTRISAGDPFFSLSRPSLALPAGSSDTLTVTFTPGDGALRNAVLTSSYFTALTGTATLTSILTGQGQWSRMEVLPADSLRFGDLPPGEHKTLSLIVANTGNDTLLATAISTQAAFAVSPATFALPGGSHRELSVSFSPTAPRSDTGSVVLSANAGRLSVGLSGRGAAARLVLRPTALDFGKVWVGSSARRLLRAANLGNQPLSISGAASDNTRFSAQPRAFDLEGGDSLEVAVHFAPVQEGIESGILTLGSQGQVELRGEAVRLGLPDSLFFDQVLAGETGVLNLVVLNPADDTLQITSALIDRIQLFQVEDSLSAATPLRIPPNSSEALRVHFSPLGTGTQRALLTLSTNAGVHTLPLVGAVSDVALRLSPAEFGRVRLGQRQSLNVMALNRTASGLTIDSLLIFPIGAPVEVLAPQLPMQVPGRDSAEVARLEFVPREPGPLNGVTLRVVGRGLERTVLLRGLGAGPRLEVKPDTLVLGPAGVHETAFDSLRLRNNGNDTLHLSNISASPSVFSTSAARLTLPPGASQPLIVQFHPTAGEGAAPEGQLELASDDPFAPLLRVTLRGLPATRSPVLQLVRPADTLRFGTVPIGQSQDQTLLVRNRGQGLLKVWLQPAGTEFMPAATDTLHLGTGQEQELAVRFVPAAAGLRQGRLTLRANDPQVPALSIPATGLGAGLFFFPATLDLGAVAVGSAADTSLALVNQTASAVEVELSLSRGAFDLGLQHLSLDAGARAAIPLHFMPDQDGEFVALLRVVGQQLEAAISGTGTPPPDLQVPAGLDLGEVELGQVGRSPLVVHNTGRGLLHLLTLSSNRLEYGTADSLPLLIPPGGERILQIWFAPRAPGLLRGVLRLQSDDPDQGDWALALSGQGKVGNWKPPRLVSQIEGGVEDFDFGSLATGAMAEKTLILVNQGAGVLRVKAISANDTQISAEPESLVVGPGERRQVQVRVLAAVGAGTEGILQLASDDPTQPLQRWRWHYHQAAARAQVLSLPLRFGASAQDRRRAQLTVANQGEAQLIVDLVDAESQLTFAADRLLVTPGQVGRVQVEYRGQHGTGLLQLPSSDPSQPQLAIPWEAPDLLDLVRTTPAAGSTGIAPRTTLSLFFDQPLRQDGLEGILTPAPLNAWQQQLQVQGDELRIPLELAEDQTYKLVILALESQSGAPLASPLEINISTSAQTQPLGRILGRATRVGDLPLVGTALLTGQEQEVAGAARLDSAGNFELAQLPAGTYHLFVREEGSSLSFTYPQALQLHPGQTLDGLEVQMPPSVLGGTAYPITAAIEVDQAPLLQADSTFVLPVRTGPVRDLTGFVLEFSFDPQALRLVEALPAAPGTRNLLYQAGGSPLFHTTTRTVGQAEFGGDLLAPREESAPDSSGVLAYLVFRTLRPTATLRLDHIVRRTLRGEDTQAGPTVRPARGADFDGNGTVGLDDLFLLADVFGQRASGAAARFDLDGSGVVDLGDFFIYADAFGLDGGVRAKLMALARTLFNLPGRCELEPAYPNPFTSQTLIPYFLPEPEEVHLEIYDLLGQRVCTLVAGPREAGPHQVSWDGRDDLGRGLASGIYLCRLQAGAFSQSRKLLLLR